MIYFIKHIDIEGPGTLGSFFEAKGYKTKIVDLGAGEKLPKLTNDVEAVVVLGGPMNVYEEEKYPFLKEEDKFIKQILKDEIPFLGICLGSQLLAKAAGAKVGKSPKKEIGFSYIQLTGEGLVDPLFQGLVKKIFVYQWHEDMFEIPLKGQLLAMGADCPHQALKFGRCAYGLQFHVEITDVSISEWSDQYLKKPGRPQEFKTNMLSDYFKNKVRFDNTAEQIYNNFLNIIVAKRALI